MLEKYNFFSVPLGLILLMMVFGAAMLLILYSGYRTR